MRQGDAGRANVSRGAAIPRERHGLYTFPTYSSSFLPGPSHRSSQHDEVTFRSARNSRYRLDTRCTILTPVYCID
ncbi:Uncharacterized protein DBV15_02432 [Temnothorax longispinosus]|uniref:Uncharacterized protein n=1 Tax=Temnothorax longispinosus TaxID=300112 RepID=A0A4S2KVS7_9HYME|nr:Uncharacterized protein DBV15_02432 [Temnothorax longispinosus]